MREHDPVMVALVIFIAAALASGLVFIAIQRDVNAQLPPDERYRYFFARPDFTRELRILRDHRRMWPHDQLRVLYWSLVGLSTGGWLFMVLYSMVDR